MDVAALRTAIRGLRLGQRLRTATDVRDQTPRPGSSTRSPAGRARPAPGSAPSPGSPAQPDRAFAATPSSHRARTVPEGFGQLPAAVAPRPRRAADASLPTDPRPPASWGVTPLQKRSRPSPGAANARFAGRGTTPLTPPPPPPSPAQGARVRSQDHPGLGQKNGRAIGPPHAGPRSAILSSLIVSGQRPAKAPLRQAPALPSH